MRENDGSAFPKLYTTAAAAKRLGLKPRTLARWRWSGTGPVYSRVGGAIRYAASDLAFFVAANRRSSTSEAQEGVQRRGR